MITISQTVIKDVRSKGEIVGQVSVVLYDTMDEIEGAIEEKDIVAYINRCITIDSLDAERRKITGGASTGIRAIMAKVKDNPELFAQIRALIGEV